jgi:hypothetical protein
MSLENLNAKMAAVNARNEGIKGGFVREKMRQYSEKHGRHAPTRAHEEDRKHSGAIKIPRVVRTLLDSITDHDLDAVARVYREAMNATHRYWRDDGKDPKTGRAKGEWVIEPDHKTRLAAANMVAAYKEGLPVQRQIHLGANFTELKDVVARFKQSPAGQRYLRLIAGGEVQESGGEKQVENAREIEPGTELQQSTDS